MHFSSFPHSFTAAKKVSDTPNDIGLSYISYNRMAASSNCDLVETEEESGIDQGGTEIDALFENLSLADSNCLKIACYFVDKFQGRQKNLEKLVLMCKEFDFVGLLGTCRANRRIIFTEEDCGFERGSPGASGTAGTGITFGVQRSWLNEHDTEECDVSAIKPKALVCSERKLYEWRVFKRTIKFGETVSIIHLCICMVSMPKTSIKQDEDRFFDKLGKNLVWLSENFDNSRFILAGVFCNSKIGIPREEKEQLRHIWFDGVNRHLDDTTRNLAGDKLVDMCIKHDLEILNGKYGDDLAGRFTCSQPSSVIDYMICSKSFIRDCYLRSFNVDYLMPGSTHHPLELELDFNSKKRTLVTKIPPQIQNEHQIGNEKLSIFIYNVNSIQKFKDYDGTKYTDFFRTNNYDVIGFVETFQVAFNPDTDNEENYDCKVHEATMTQSGGIVVYVHERWLQGNQQVRTQLDHLHARNKSDFMWRLIKRDNIEVFVCTAYNRPNQNKKYLNVNFYRDLGRSIRQIRDVNNKPNIIIMGDFNSRIGIEDSTKKRLIHVWFDESKRKLRDTFTDKAGTELINLCITYDLEIMNGKYGDDLEGDFTSITSKGNTVVDYIMCSKPLLKRAQVVKFFVDKTVSRSRTNKHYPLVLELQF